MPNFSLAQHCKGCSLQHLSGTAYCKWSKTGAEEGLDMRLIVPGDYQSATSLVNFTFTVSLAVWSIPRAKRMCLLALLDIGNAISLCLRFCCMSNRQFYVYEGIRVRKLASFPGVIILYCNYLNLRMIQFNARNSNPGIYVSQSLSLFIHVH